MGDDRSKLAGSSFPLEVWAWALRCMFIYLFPNLCVLDLVWERLCVQDSWIDPF
jgi:hypothetical protein